MTSDDLSYAPDVVEYVIERNIIRMTAEQLKNHRMKRRLSILKNFDNKIEVEKLRYSMEESPKRKRAIQTRIAVLELKKEQFLKEES